MRRFARKTRTGKHRFSRARGSDFTWVCDFCPVDVCTNDFRYVRWAEEEECPNNQPKAKKT